MTNDILQKIAAYGDKYVDKHLVELYGKKDLLNEKEWYESLIFLFNHVFYQGRKDSYSDDVKIAAVKTLEDFQKENTGNKESILDKRNLEVIKEKLKKVIGSNEESKNNGIKLDIKRVGKASDIQMVIDTLKFISEADKRNIVKYSRDKVEEGKVKDHYLELKSHNQGKKNQSGIWLIGPKISSFYLRDVVLFYSIEVQPKDLIYLQPIDIWVTKVAEKVGIIDIPEEKNTRAYINKNYDQIRQEIVDKCLSSEVSPTKFNAGAWYMGSNSLDCLLSKLKQE